MKSAFTLLVLALAGPVLFAQNDTTNAKTAASQKEQCATYVANKKSPIADVCFAYARGLRDALDGDLAWADDAHKKVVIGVWADGVTVDQLVRVFVKYANENPESLNQSAATIFRQSAEAAKLYTYNTP